VKHIKLCLVIPSLQAGGMERVMSELAGYFASGKGIEIHLILYGITREIFYTIPDTIIVHKPQFSFNNNLRLFYTIKTILFLRKAIRRIDPESILSFGEYWNSFVLIALQSFKYPVFISDRCQPDKSLGRFHDWLRRKLYPKATGVIAQTEKAKEIYHTQFQHKNIEVIGNPIRTIEMQENILRENIVLMVGRLIKSKHQDKLIELFLRIAKPDWQLVLVGYDHLKQNNSEQLKKIIRENHAEDLVILEGKQTDVEAYYLKSKIFAFTSSSEGFPNAIGEAMSAGIPVVAFDCVAGPSEMIKNNHNGFLIPLFDYKQFQEKLNLLMDDDKLRTTFGSRSREDIGIFSITHIGNKYLDLILKKNKINNKLISIK
jgi:GalNAc-alpha-(1->4)-GalNAc-alpha-(1->3)-diNAcBac-PP-undecaprenol alpha-1,4-N-acetyl-D-galactosaminyltransferase